MQVNYRGLIEILAVIALCVIALVFLMPPASAVNNTTGIVNYFGNAPLDYIPRIDQGDKVYLNDTVDISGVTGWPDSSGEYRLMYYGRWMSEPSPGDVDPQYTLSLPGKYRSGKSESQYRFWIDPAIFRARPGYWYQWSSNNTRSRGGETAGNLRAFYVVGDYRKVFNATSNQSEISYPGGNYTERTIAPAPLLPEKHVADYVVARGDNLTWPLGGEYRMWLFGRVDGVYGNPGGYIPSDVISHMETGDYTLVMQSPGNNTIYEATCNSRGSNPNACDVLVPGLYGKAPVEVAGLLPSVVLDRLRVMLLGTDDTLTEYKVEVKDPYIDLVQANEITLKSKDYLDVRGYTNVAPGTKISVTLDEGKIYKDYINLWRADTVAVRTSPGNMSYYRAYVPIDYENLAADARNHTLMVTTALGGNVQRDFKLSTMPADSFKPNATLKYIEDRNPFVPTPTPIVNTVTVERTREVIRTVVTVITPDVQDYGKVWEGGMWWITTWIGTWIIIAVLSLIGICTVLYFIWVWWRGRKE